MLKYCASRIIFSEDGVLRPLFQSLIFPEETFMTSDSFFAVIFLSMGLVIDAGVYFIYCRLQQKLELDEEFKKVYRYREQELKLYQGIQRQIEQLREKRHEFANQIQTAYIMCEQGASQEELEKYLQNMEERYQREWI